LIKGRDVIIHLAIKYGGDWNAVYQAIKSKEAVSEDDINASLFSLTSPALTIIDDDYPERLKKIYKPPFVLFYHGNKELLADCQEALAVIGTRQPSAYGIMMTRRIVEELVGADIIIVSGLAKGIDGIAHETALTHQGKTIAVLGSGIDVCYPKENKAIYDKMKLGQLIVSEYPGVHEPHKDNFPWRNRIIAGLADAVFVSEARKRSGTLITVGYALYSGKDVYALPHPANTDSSCNRLIKDGATLVESAHDIIEGMRHVTVEEAPRLSEEKIPKSFI